MRLHRFSIALAVLAAGSVALFELDPSLKYEVDTPKYRWIGKQIYSTGQSIDTVFIGTSRIWTDVDTAELTRRFPDRPSYNFGTNWHGRQGQWVMLRDLLARKSVRHVVLEVMHTEPPGFHPVSRVMGSVHDVPWDRFADVTGRQAWGVRPPFKRAVTDLLTYVFGQAVKGYYFLLHRWLVGSFADEPFEDGHGELRVELSAEEKEAFWRTIRDIPERYEPFADEALAFDDGYLARFAALCREHGATLHFLLLPGRNEPLLGPRYREVLLRHGTILDVPFDDLYRWSLWRDAYHLNEEGARLLTSRLAESPLFASPAVVGVDP